MEINDVPQVPSAALGQRQATNGQERVFQSRRRDNPGGGGSAARYPARTRPESASDIFSEKAIMSLPSPGCVFLALSTPKDRRLAQPGEGSTMSRKGGYRKALFGADVWHLLACFGPTAGMGKGDMVQSGYRIHDTVQAFIPRTGEGSVGLSYSENRTSSATTA